MKKVMMSLMILVLCSLVVAEGSEITAGFNIGDRSVGEDYVRPQPGFWEAYGVYVIGAIIVLVVVIIFLKKKKSPKTKVIKRKAVKKKVSKKRKAVKKK